MIASTYSVDCYYCVLCYWEFSGPINEDTKQFTLLLCPEDKR